MYNILQNIPSESALVPPSVPMDTGLPDGNARDINYALYIILYGMKNTLEDGLYKNQKELTEYLKAQGLCSSAISSFLSLISNLESIDPSKNPDYLNPQILQDLNQMKTMWGQIFGNDATFDSNGNIQPDPNSVLGKYMAEVEKENTGSNPPFNIANDPLYQECNGLAQYFNTTTVTGHTDMGKFPWKAYTAPGTILSMLLTGKAGDVYVMFDAIVCNHWLNNNPGVGPQNNPDYLVDLFTKGSQVVQTASGLNSEQYALMNQNNNAIQTVIQALDEAVTSMSEANEKAERIAKK